MSVLSQKLQDAAKQFQAHNFRKSLQLYQDCLSFCLKTDQAQGVVSNVLSAKATLQYITGQYDLALQTVNQVLRSDPTHFLCLMRRSQVYKKQGKLKRALKDISSIALYCPDNLQIAALKAQIEQLISKESKQGQSSSQSEEQNQEELALNFSGLKLIDRKSSDLSNTKKQRKSRVTILGDMTFQYNRQEEQTAQSAPDEPITDKALRTYKEIQLDDDDEEQSAPKVSLAPIARKKSILKNRGNVSIFIHQDNKQVRRSRYLGRQSHLLEKIKDIQGKLIRSASHQHEDNPNIKQVQFRKSIHNEQQDIKIFVSNRSTESRKSCLKMPTFESPTPNLKKRGSKLQAISSFKIDGHVISNNKRKSYQEDKQDSDSDNEDDQHNIFGSNAMMIGNKWQQKLDMMRHESCPGNALGKKKSILKKQSFLAGGRESILRKQQSTMNVTSPSPFSTVSKPALKSKKSVVFSTTM